VCRLFGFRSVIQSQVHRSLISADNALLQQSERHPDGWGVAYYLAHAPHLIKSVSTAVDDQLFRHVSGVVTSETVVAHLRKATQGELSTINTHPFQYGTWVFAHNGNLRGFAEVKGALVEKIPPVLRRFILGTSDSEVLFYLLLGKMARRCELHRRGFPLEELAAAARETIEEVTALVGPIHAHDGGPPHETYLTFIITNGNTMLAHQGGKALHVSTHKARCPDRELCSSYAPECERRGASGDFVSHLIFSSERLQGDNVWEAMSPGEMIGVDWRMRLRVFPTETRGAVELARRAEIPGAG
jgi:glutamine amidotransferase